MSAGEIDRLSAAEELDRRIAAKVVLLDEFRLHGGVDLSEAQRRLLVLERLGRLSVLGRQPPAVTAPRSICSMGGDNVSELFRHLYNSDLVPTPTRSIITLLNVDSVIVCYSTIANHEHSLWFRTTCLMRQLRKKRIVMKYTLLTHFLLLVIVSSLYYACKTLRKFQTQGRCAYRTRRGLYRTLQAPRRRSPCRGRGRHPLQCIRRRRPSTVRRGDRTS